MRHAYPPAVFAAMLINAALGQNLGAPCGGMACANDMPDSDEFISGSTIPAAIIPVSDGYGNALNYTVDPGNGKGRGVVVMAALGYDLFTRYMLTDNQSLDMFLGVDPVPDVDFVFLGHTDPSIPVNLRSALKLRMTAIGLNSTTTKLWLERMFFGTQTVQEMTAADPTQRDFTTPSTNVIGRVLRSPTFNSIVKRVVFHNQAGSVISSVNRLDGFFQFVNTQDLHNHAAVNPMVSTVHKVDGSIVCQKNKSDPGSQGKVAFVYAPELPRNCSYEDVVLWFGEGGANPAIVIMGGPSDPIKEIGQHLTGDDESGFYTVGTVIPYNAEVLQGFTSGTVQNVTIVYDFDVGQYFSVGVDFKLRQIGSPINPILAVLSWEGQYLNYKEKLRSELAKPVYVLPILQSVVGDVRTTGSSTGYTATVAIPNLVKNFNKGYLEVRFGCPGNGDFECPVWDRIATVTLQCPSQPSPVEINRWITPYRRSVGHWVTDVTPLLPLFYEGAAGSCNFSLSGFSSWMHEPWVTDMSLRLDVVGNDTPTRVEYLFSGGTFDVGYNNRTAVAVQVSGGKRAEIFAYITGHGSDEYNCCEFQATRHIFTVNGVEFTATFTEPLDMWGCTHQVPSGVEPNGFGAWWFGRNGWCNGRKVIPFQPDVTTAINFNGANSITYRAQLGRQSRCR
eukprot:TRINITY_DN3756_c0_g1_i1.p1 TRINITY_DN3756_c0_g1~~TRINITY_DN3756_c0_g1_i1.p1  ORF type:complete len:674 (+),score=62.75 TRINITY_DN3756_c0_g1_i1:73-2094(+)